MDVTMRDVEVVYTDTIDGKFVCNHFERNVIQLPAILSDNVLKAIALELVGLIDTDGIWSKDGCKWFFMPDNSNMILIIKP